MLQVNECCDLGLRIVRHAGGPVHVGMVDEAATGQQSFMLQMNELDLTMIPIGDVHFIENRQCQDAIIVGSFSNADPGVELTLSVRAARSC